MDLKKFVRDFINAFSYFGNIPLMFYYSILLHPLEFGAFLLHTEYDIDVDEIQRVENTMYDFIHYVGVAAVASRSSEMIPRCDTYRYVEHVYSKQGFRGCYRGILPRILEYIVMTSVSDFVWNFLTGCKYESDNEYDLKTELCYQGLRVVLSQPFHTVMILSFTEFSSDESHNMFQIFYYIHEEMGYKGFYMGMTARLSAEAVFNVSCSIFNHIMNLSKRHANNLFEIIVMFLRDAGARRLSYPFLVISHRMIALKKNWHWLPDTITSCGF